MPSLVLIGPAVRPAIGNIQTNRQTDRHNAFKIKNVTLKILILTLRASLIGNGDTAKNCSLLVR